MELNDQIRALPADAFASKHELLSEVDVLRALLAEVEDLGASEVVRRWNERSGRKGLHEQDVDMLEALVRSKIEHGGK